MRGISRTAGFRSLPGMTCRRAGGLACCASLLLFALPGPASATDVAGRNREGNKLFKSGRYADAEKAYRDAQTAAPGRPELMYNTGNALLKQKKYEQAVQSLKQAMNSGDRTLRSSSWFNAGNALFESGKLKEAIDAYTQSLRITPSDADAKHNLELALRRQQEQQKQQKQQNQSGEDQPRDQERKEKDQGDSGQQQKDQKPDGKQPPPPRDKGGQDKPADPRATSAENADASFSKERALQILDALRNQELVEQKKLLEARAKRKASGRDW